MELHSQKSRWSLEAWGDRLAAATGTEHMAAPSGSRALQEQHTLLWGARGQPRCGVWRSQKGPEASGELERKERQGR